MGQCVCGGLVRTIKCGQEARRKPGLQTRLMAMVECASEAADTQPEHQGAPKACVDEEDACPEWARNGECEKNAAYMETACALSCQTCLPHKLEAEWDE